MKTLTIDFYHVKEKLYRCKGCDIRFQEPKCPACGETHSVEMIVPKLMDEIVLVGAKQYDIVTYDGETFPVWARS